MALIAVHLDAGLSHSGDDSVGDRYIISPLFPPHLLYTEYEGSRRDQEEGGGAGPSS